MATRSDDQIAAANPRTTTVANNVVSYHQRMGDAEGDKNQKICPLIGSDKINSNDNKTLQQIKDEERKSSISPI